MSKLFRRLVQLMSDNNKNPKNKMKTEIYFQTSKILKEENPSFVPPSFKDLHNIKKGDTIKMMLIVVDNQNESEDREVFFANVLGVEKKKGMITTLVVSPDTKLYLANINHNNTFRIKTENVLRCGKNYREPIGSDFVITPSFL